MNIKDGIITVASLAGGVVSGYYITKYICEYLFPTRRTGLLSPKFGWLIVNSNVPCKFMIDGAGPFNSGEKIHLKPGVYTIKPLDISGYKTPPEQKVKIEEGKITELKFVYTKLGGVGGGEAGGGEVVGGSAILRVTANLPGKFLLNGKWYNYGTELQLAPGRYEVRPEKISGYIVLPPFAIVTLEPGKRYELRFIYRKRITPGPGPQPI